MPGTGDAGDSAGPSPGGSRPGPMVVVVDQFEECWTRAPAELCDRFLEIVARRRRRIDRRPVRRHRARRPARSPLEHSGVGHTSAPGTYCSRRSRLSSSTRLVVRPAARVGVTFEDGVVADLVAEAATHRLPAVVAVHAHRALRPPRDGIIGREALEAIGGMAGAIGRRAEGVFVGLDDGPDRSPASCSAVWSPPDTAHPTPAAGRCLSELSAASVRRRPVRGRPAARHRPRSGDARADHRGRPRGAAGPLVAARRLGRRGPPVAGPAAPPLARRPGLGHRRAARQRALPGGAPGGGHRGAGRRGAPASEVERMFVEAGRQARDADVPRPDGPPGVSAAG